MRISDWSSDVCSSDLQYRVAFEVENVTRNGKPEPYQTERRGNGVRLYIGSEDRLLPGGEHEYAITYRKIGRASCRERVCQYVSISVVAVALKQEKNKIYKGKTRA